jgi:hypothetical protein
VAADHRHDHALKTSNIIKKNLKFRTRKISLEADQLLLKDKKNWP